MVWSSVRVCAWLEILVVVFQVLGVLALGVTRLAHSRRWHDRGRLLFVFALVGLGTAGAFCGRHDSEFALFAGGTMTMLLIGMTAGCGVHEMTLPHGPRMVADAPAAG